MDDYAIFLVSRSSDGEREWFSARDPAAGVVIPAESRDYAYALVSSLNRAFSHHARQLLSEADKREKVARVKALEDAESICNQQASRFRNLSKSESCLSDIRWDSRDTARRTMESYAERHETDAAAIRALQSEER